MQTPKKAEEELVSIIMPACDADRFIAESIQSVVNQTYLHWELIVVDDCSNDATVEAVRRFIAKDDRIKLLINESRQGAALSRNRAIREAKGHWIAFLDSDDLWDREKLELQIGHMVSKCLAFSYTSYREITEDGVKNDVICSGPTRITKAGMSCFCWPGCLTVVYDRDRMGVVEIPSLAKHNDYAMWLSLIKKDDCFLYPQTLASYRLRSKSVSHGKTKLNQVQDMYLVWHKSEGKCCLSALAHSLINAVFWFVKKAVYVKRVTAAEGLRRQK